MRKLMTICEMFITELFSFSRKHIKRISSLSICISVFTMLILTQRHTWNVNFIFLCRFIVTSVSCCFLNTVYLWTLTANCITVSHTLSQVFILIFVNSSRWLIGYFKLQQKFTSKINNSTFWKNQSQLLLPNCNNPPKINRC